MKKLIFNRKKILRAIFLATMALALMAKPVRAQVIPTTNPDGSLTLSGSGTYVHSGDITVSNTDTFAIGISTDSGIYLQHSEGTISATASGSGYGSAGDHSAYGILGSSSSDYITILNTGSLYGYSTSSANDHGGINSVSGYYGFGLYANSSGTGLVTLNNGTATSTSASAYGSGPSGGYGLYGYTSGSGNLVINNFGTATGFGTTVGALEGPSGEGIGINAISASGDPATGTITINNSGTAIGTGEGFTYGISTNSDAASIVINNSGVAQTGNSPAGYAIFASSNSGDITVNNLSGGQALITAPAPILSASDVIHAESHSGNVTIVNDGTVDGSITNSSGLYGSSDTGTASITNNGSITVGNTDVYGGAVGINGRTQSGTVLVVNNGNVFGTSSTEYQGYSYATAGISTSGNVTVINNGTTTAQGAADDAPSYGMYGESDSGDVNLVNNAGGTSTGIMTGGGTDSAYGMYAHTNSGKISITNSGHVTGTASSAYAYGISATSYGSAGGSSAPVTITNTSTGVIQTSGGSSASGIYLYGFSSDAHATITNAGTITSSHYAINTYNFNGSTTLNLQGGSLHSDSGYAVIMGAGDNVVNIYSQTLVEGIIFGGDGANNILNFNEDIYASLSSEEQSIFNADVSTALGDPTHDHVIEVGSSNYDVMNFSLIQTVAMATPEPSSFALLFSSLLLLASRFVWPSLRKLRSR